MKQRLIDIMIVSGFLLIFIPFAVFIYISMQNSFMNEDISNQFTQKCETGDAEACKKLNEFEDLFSTPNQGK